MKRVLIALAAPLVLIGAAHPPGDGRFYPPVPALEPVAGPVTYRPCRPGPGDDRCIQLYERGVRAAYARWLRSHGAPERVEVAAVGGPAEEPPPRSRRHSRDSRHDEHRCHDAPGRGHGEPRGL